MAEGRKKLTSPHGDVRTLLPFRKAVIIYDLTFHFCHTFLSRSDLPDQWFVDLAKTRPAETVANMVIVFLHQEDYLLQAQLDVLEQKFLACGGFREQLLDARLKRRKR